MTTMYAGETRQLAIAQQALDEHVVSTRTGLCLTCGVPGPCLCRETAAMIFVRFDRLPQRVPGLTIRRELAGTRGSADRAPWFGQANSVKSTRSLGEGSDDDGAASADAVRLEQR